MADGQVVFEITADGRHVKADIKEITKAIQAEGKNWDKAAGSATSGIEDKFASMTKGILAKLTAAGIGAALLGWGADALEAASDLREVQNVVDTVFGDGAQQIENWSKKAGQQFGLTETQAKKFTSTLGAMMKSSGLAGGEIVNMSTDLAGLAADMASFYNLDFETAFEKIRSGISGETMPLKQLGINMSVANLNAFALAQGLEKTFDQMDQGEQTMLRYQYLMQATSDAQGDFEKTSEGFANAQRRITTALDTISTIAGGYILDTIEPLISKTAEWLEQMTSTPERTVIDDFNEIEVDTAGKMADLEETYNKASDIIKLIDEIQKQTVTLKDGSTITFEELFKDIGNIEKNGGDVRGYLESLGVDVDYVIQKYNVWKESTRQLTSTVPALTSVINSETGAIDGGTEALQRNLDQWKKNEEKKLAWTAYYAKARALEEKKAELYLYEFDAGAAQQAVKRQIEKLDKLREELGIGGEGYEMVIKTNATGGQGILTKEEKAWNDAIVTLGQLRKAEADATKEYERQAAAWVEKDQEIADGKQALIEKYGEEEEAAKDAADGVRELTDEEKKAAEETKKAAEEAQKAFDDYVKGVHESATQAVNSVIKGFDEVGKAGDSFRKKQNELAGEETQALNDYEDVWNKWGSSNDALRKMAADQGKLTDREREAYEALVKVRNAQTEVNQSLDQYKPASMEAALQSQIEYMEEYMSNLEKAQQMGLSDELLASLADGSKESAEYLAGLVGDAEGAAKVDEAFRKVTEKKKEFSDALAEQKLSADEIYDGLAQKAAESIAAMNLSGEAEEAMAATVDGLAQGIESEAGAVAKAVDAVEAELNRLDGLNFNLNFGSNYGAWKGASEVLQGLLDGEFEVGLDRVPFDGFLAELHEGEGILTAEENRIWQRFKNGDASSRNLDYDMMGAAVGANVHAGGDVYLDRRIVGKVISGQQGQEYRNLQRSGWQK